MIGGHLILVKTCSIFDGVVSLTEQRCFHVASERTVTSGPVSSLNTIGLPLTSNVVLKNDLKLLWKLTTHSVFHL